MHSGIRFLAAVLAASPIVAIAQTAPLTLAEAQRRAVDRSRQLAAQELSIAGSRDRAIAAGQLPDPVLKLELQNVPIEGPDRFRLDRDTMTMRSVGVMQEWTRSEKRELKRERFEREADKTRAEKQASIAAIQKSVALAWLDTYYAQAMVATIDEQAAAAQLEIAAADSAYRAGRGSQADVLAVHGARASLEDRTSDFTRKLRAARTMLARWVGDAAEAPLGARPDISRMHLQEHSIEHQISQHPELEILRRQEDIARTEARLAQANTKADWSFEVMYNNRASQFGDMATLSVSVPLQIFQKDRQGREVAATLAAVEQARAQREETERNHASEIRAMVEEWRTGLERIKRYENELLPLSRERTQASLAAYQGGKASAGDLLMARRNEIEVRMQALQIESDTARLWAQLEFLIADPAVLPVAFFEMRSPKEAP